MWKSIFKSSPVTTPPGLARHLGVLSPGSLAWHQDPRTGAPCRAHILVPPSTHLSSSLSLLLCKTWIIVLFIEQGLSKLIYVERI